jgi:RNA-directed DNA polymerase
LFFRMSISPSQASLIPVAGQSATGSTEAVVIAGELINPADLARLFSKVTDAYQLAFVLNKALTLDLAENPGHRAKPVSAKLLHYYAYHKKATRYRTFQIPKRTRGEVRTIKAPDHGLLRLQRLLLACLTASFTTSHNASHGFVPGRSVLTNAQPHSGHRFVLNLDLRNFFANTPIGRVVAVLQLTPFSLEKEAAYLVANLCCDQGCLPQGAPTSPLLTNAVCQRLDRRLHQLATRHRCTYTRYADDLTFSANRPVFRAGFHQQLNAILATEGYQQNELKQRLQTPESRQEVTGIVVNERPNVPREYVRQIRAMLHNWETKGYKAASDTLRLRYSASKAGTHPKDKMPKLERVLAGKIAYLGMVRGKEDNLYLTSLAKLKELIPKKEASIFESLLAAWDSAGLDAAIQLKDILL